VSHRSLQNVSGRCICLNVLCCKCIKKTHGDGIVRPCVSSVNFSTNLDEVYWKGALFKSCVEKFILVFICS
jgi:hypothetical protein